MQLLFVVEKQKSPLKEKMSNKENINIGKAIIGFC